MKVSEKDGFLMPDPETGWSREILTVKDASVWPVVGFQRFPVCGVTYADGRDCPEAAFYREDKRRMMLPVPERPRPEARLPGRHLWGGQVFAHFGHFLCETVPRLWAASRVDVESLVVIGRHEGLKQLAPWQQRFFEMLEVRLPITFIEQPTQVEELLVPGQAFGLGKIARGTPEFRDMLTSIPRHIQPKGPERIYISRTKTGKKGRVLNEISMEQNFIKQGYVAYHPQQHSLEDQLAQYLAATHVVGLDSSAFHLLGLVARPEQKIAIILRRNMSAYVNIQRQLEGMCGHSPAIINTLLGDWMPPNHKAASRLSWGQLDHPRMVALLAEQGFIDHPERWKFPSDDDFKIAFENFRKRMGGEVVFRPVETPIDQALA